jgi:hypothetical protein
MVGIRFPVEQDHFRHRENALHDGINLFGVAALREVGDAFDQLTGHVRNSSAWGRAGTDDSTEKNKSSAWSAGA